MSRVYLAGPMTGIPQFNYPVFDEAAKDLRARGYEVFSPGEMDDPATREAALASKDGRPGSGVVNGETWGDFLARDVKLIADEVDAVVVLPKWEASRGARLEAFVARLCDKPILRYVRDDLGRNIPLPPVSDADLEAAHGIAAPGPAPETVLEEAERLVGGDRGRDYGRPIHDFSRTAQMMGAVLGCEVRAEQVPLLMICVKLSRLVQSPRKRDSLTDIAGYARTLEMVWEDS